MRNRRKRAQREEIRKILAAVRAELATQREYDLLSQAGRPVVHLDELFRRARQQVTRES